MSRLPPESDGGVIESMDGDTLVLEMPWNRLYGLIYLAGGAIVVPATALNPQTPPPMIPVVAAIGLLAVYAAVANFVNRTTIRADRASLEVSVGPVPWIGSGSIATNEIIDFDIDRQVQHNHRRTNHTFVLGGDKHRGDTLTWSLSAALRDGSSWKVTGGWTSGAGVKWAAWRLREHLGIT